MVRDAAPPELIHEIALGFAGDRDVDATPDKLVGQIEDMLLAPADERPVNDEKDLPGRAHRDTFH